MNGNTKNHFKDKHVAKVGRKRGGSLDDKFHIR